MQDEEWTIKILNCGAFKEMRIILEKQPSVFAFRFNANNTWSTPSDEEEPFLWFLLLKNSLWQEQNQKIFFYKIKDNVSFCLREHFVPAE